MVFCAIVCSYGSDDKVKTLADVFSEVDTEPWDFYRIHLILNVVFFQEII